MLEHIVQTAQDRQLIEDSGWEAVLNELQVRLSGLGYSETIKMFYEQTAVHFALWTARRHINRSKVTDEDIAAFLTRHLSTCRCKIKGVRQRIIVRAALGHVKATLDAGGHRSHQPKEPNVIDLEVQRFDEYLRNIAGLRETTRQGRRQYLREFLTDVFPDKHLAVSSITARTVIDYISRCARRDQPSKNREIACCLRSYFRFLQLQGEADEALRLSVPTPAHPRPERLPRVLTDEQLSRLLNVFDRKTAVGCRDYAITRCLMDLGLRALEVANLRIDDIDWRKAMIRIRANKARRDDELPLPATTGKAVADYLLHVRPKTPARQVFLHVNAPLGRGVARQTISLMIRKAAIELESKRP